MISNIYILAAYNRYVNGLAKMKYYFKTRDVIGRMVMIRNITDHPIRLFGLIQPNEEIAFPEEAWELWKVQCSGTKDDFSITTRFMVSEDEFAALRPDITIDDEFPRRPAPVYTIGRDDPEDRSEVSP